MKDSLVRRIYHIVLTVVLILAGLFLINGCLWIYYTGGDQIYTLDKIGSAFRRVAGLMYLALASILGSVILDFVLPNPKKRKPEKNYAMMLKNLQEKTNLDACPDQHLRHMILGLRKQRILLLSLNFVVLAMSCGAFGFYIFSGDDRFPSLIIHERVNIAMIRNVLAWLTCLTPPFIFAVCTAYISRKNMRTETELLRQLNLQRSAPKAAEQFNVCLLLVRLVVVTAAVALIVIGYIGDGWMDVLTKAAAICTECVGLG